MTSILTYIKENHLAILTIIALGAVVIFGNLFTSGSSDELRQVGEHLLTIEQSLDDGLGRISNYERLTEERNEQFRQFQDYLGGEIDDLRNDIERAGFRNLEAGDRYTESGILIEDGLRLINKIRAEN